MKEQLISFETAKLAKEKGFELQSNPFGYITKFYNHNTKTLLAYGRTGKTDLSKAYYAPTQSLLQKWLREVHKIDVQPICNYHYKLGKQYHLGIIFVNKDNKVDTIIIKETDKSLDTINRYYYSYEESLEAGLQEALKLIQ